MPELSDWEKELISQYGGDDDDDTEAAAQDGAATGDEVKGEQPAGAPSVAAEDAPSAAAASPAATPALVEDAVPAADAAPAAVPSESSSADTLQAEVVKLRAERESLNTLITQWQTSVKNLEEKAQQAAATAQQQQQQQLQRLQQLQSQLQSQQAMHSQLLQQQQQQQYQQQYQPQYQQQYQQQQQQQQQQTQPILTAQGLQQASQVTYQGASGPVPYAATGQQYGCSSRPSEAVAKKGSWAEYETDDGQKYYHNQASGETSWERPAQYIKGTTQPHTPWWADSAQRGGESRVGPPGATLFVARQMRRGEYDNFDSHDLQRAFEKYGTLLRATITLDRETGVSKGFGFVSFSTAEEADTAMQAMHGTMIGGKRLRIEKATAKQEMGIKEKPFEG